MCFSWQPGNSPVVFAGGTDATKPPNCISTAVSVDGRIAGQIALTKTGGHWAPFRRETNGGVILLNELPGSAGASRAYGIYKSTVVAQSRYPPVAVQWDYDGDVAPLLNTTSTAYAINSKGHVVGAVQGPSQGNAWVWQKGFFNLLARARIKSVGFRIYHQRHRRDRGLHLCAGVPVHGLLVRQRVKYFGLWFSSPTSCGDLQ